MASTEARKLDVRLTDHQRLRLKDLTRNWTAPAKTIRHVHGSCCSPTAATPTGGAPTSTSPRCSGSISTPSREVVSQIVGRQKTAVVLHFCDARHGKTPPMERVSIQPLPQTHDGLVKLARKR